ncbi:MAG TPA: TRAP transporter TatT component family protein [Blastocatellia bacterium]|nr:TRAP transporter TatT component family protein [Blastocatellia bacterium]
MAQSSAKPSSKGASPKTVAAVPLSKDPIGDADRLFSRGDVPAQDQQAMAILESALTTDGKNYELLWRAARATYYVGDFGAEADKLKHFDKGIALAQRAVALQPNSVEGHFWLAANYGGKAQLVGALKALSTVKKIRAEMQTVVKLNDAYENGNAYLALGEIDRELPGIMGGNKKRAITFYEQGLKVAPENLDLKVALSKAYKDAGRKDDARRLLEEVVKAQPTTRIQRDAQEEAKQLLNK